MPQRGTHMTQAGVSWGGPRRDQAAVRLHSNLDQICVPRRMWFSVRRKSRNAELRRGASFAEKRVRGKGARGVLWIPAGTASNCPSAPAVAPIATLVVSDGWAAPAGVKHRRSCS